MLDTVLIPHWKETLLRGVMCWPIVIYLQMIAGCLHLSAMIAVHCLFAQYTEYKCIRSCELTRRELLYTCVCISGAAFCQITFATCIQDAHAQ